ncbi:hypothetical protein [Streptococcus anginosus]|uniref:hypothetical protein n=1 Tax=Streptococcus anginosus TaxID=1328 RepID=UPI000422A3D8|nr:hypothetical protein [Streptococcus anginosus]
MDGLVFDLDTFEVYEDVPEEVSQEKVEVLPLDNFRPQSTQTSSSQLEIVEGQMSIFDFIPFENSS